MREKRIADDSAKKKGSRRYRFNFIDLLIILTVLLLVAIGISLFSPVSWIDKISKKDEVRIQYTVEFLGVDESLIEMIKEESLAVDSVSKNSLGRVRAVDASTPYSVLSYDEVNDAGVLSAYPDKYNVLVTIEADAKYESAEGYTINDLRIAVGEKMSLRFPDYAGEGFCISVSVVG